MTALCLSVDGTHLISGDQQGLIYIWSTQQLNQSEDTGLVNTYELHKDKGPVTNLVAIHRPLTLFGLTANMKSFEVTDLFPLQKFPGPSKEQIEISLKIEDKQRTDLESNLWTAMAQSEEDSYFVKSALSLIGKVEPA